jgi:hypothetical protein
MECIDGIAWKLPEQSFLDHAPSAALVLLGRLEDEVNGPVELSGLGQRPGGAEQHGGVSVMPAGMHPAGDLGLVGHARRFLDGKRVHVGPDPDGTAGSPSRQRPNHACAAKPFRDLQTQRGERSGNEGRRLMFLKCQLRIAVQVVAPRNHLGDFIWLHRSPHASDGVDDPDAPRAAIVPFQDGCVALARTLMKRSRPFRSLD